MKHWKLCSTPNTNSTKFLFTAIFFAAVVRTNEKFFLLPSTFFSIHSFIIIYNCKSMIYSFFVLYFPMACTFISFNYNFYFIFLCAHLHSFLLPIFISSRITYTKKIIVWLKIKLLFNFDFESSSMMRNYEILNLWKFAFNLLNIGDDF